MRLHKAIVGAVGRVAAGLVLLPVTCLASADFEGALRGDLEDRLGPAADAYRAAPGDDDRRRVYADVLFKLGRVWEANDVIAPLATPESSNASDLLQGAKLAYLTGSYSQARRLYTRLRTISEPESEDHTAAGAGLVMVAYQTNRFGDASGIDLPRGDPEDKRGALLTFLERFDGEPYQLEWTAAEKVARLAMLNDIEQPGGLPLVQLEVNGQPVRLILDTGGDCLFLDEAVAKRIGIRTFAERQAKYAYTKGEYVTEPLGAADTVGLDTATLRNVPVVVAQWKRLVGDNHGDGVLPTQVLKQFLTTVDYSGRKIVLRERSSSGREQMLEALGESPIRMPFFLSGSHLMFARGSLNDRGGLNFLIDSGLAASMPLILLNETVDYLGIDKVPIEGTPYFYSPLDSHGLGEITRGAAQALGNVLVEDKPYWRLGFFWDGLISHQFLRHLGSWTIDFDTMSFYFSPAEAPLAGSGESQTGPLSEYAGAYEVAPGIDLVVTVADGVVFLQAPGQAPVALESAGNDMFETRLAQATVEFRRDEAGAITGLVLRQRGSETTATRKQ